QLCSDQALPPLARAKSPNPRQLLVALHHCLEALGYLIGRYFHFNLARQLRVQRRSMLMVVFMIVIVGMRQFRLLLGSLIRLCYLGWGQSHAFRCVCICRLAHSGAEQAVYASYLLYGASCWGVKPPHA